MLFNSYIIGQILTLISYLIFWYSRFIKNKRDILLWDNVSRLFAILSFIFLKVYDGIKNTLYVILRNILGRITNKKDKKIKIVIFLLMFLLLIFIYGVNYNKLSTLCIAICGILNLYGVIMCNEQGIRIFGMFGSGFYALFMFLTANIVGAVCEIICFGVMLASYLKYKKCEI